MDSKFTSLEDRNWDQIVRSILYRMNVILSERFGCRALYRSVAQLRFEAPELMERFQKFFADGTRSRVQIEEEFIIPVRLACDVVGYVILINGASVAPDKLEDALNLVDHGVIDSIAVAEKLNVLVGLERQSTAQFSPGNVVQFRTRGQESAPAKIDSEVRSQYVLHVFRHTILVLGANANQIQSVAVSFHECFQNAAMVPLSALDPLVLEDALLWSELGRVTIFVPNVSSLLEHQLEAIHKMTSMYQGDTYPVVVAGQPDDAPLNHPELLNKVFRMTFRYPDSTSGEPKVGELVENFLLFNPIFSTSSSLTSH